MARTDAELLRDAQELIDAAYTVPQLWESAVTSGLLPASWWDDPARRYGMIPDRETYWQKDGAPALREELFPQPIDRRMAIGVVMAQARIAAFEATMREAIDLVCRAWGGAFPVTPTFVWNSREAPLTLVSRTPSSHPSGGLFWYTWGLFSYLFRLLPSESASLLKSMSPPHGLAAKASSWFPLAERGFFAAVRDVIVDGVTVTGQVVARVPTHRLGHALQWPWWDAADDRRQRAE